MDPHTPAAQLELPLPRRRAARAGLGPTPLEDAASLVLFLRGRGWVSAAAIAQGMGWEDRRARAAAEAAEGRVLSFPGSPGYRLTREATANERDQAIRAFHSQARRMLARAGQISSLHHRHSA